MGRRPHWRSDRMPETKSDRPLRRQSRAERRMAFAQAALRAFDGLEEWYDTHPDASFGAIEAEARQRRRELMGQGLSLLINGRETGDHTAAPTCAGCGQPLEFEDYRTRTVYGLEGDSDLSRAYYVCSRCTGQTLFPPGPETPAPPRPLE